MSTTVPLSTFLQLEKDRVRVSVILHFTCRLNVSSNQKVRVKCWENRLCNVFILHSYAKAMKCWGYTVLKLNTFSFFLEPKCNFPQVHLCTKTYRHCLTIFFFV